jgi:uncharacterized membrane protein
MEALLGISLYRASVVVHVIAVILAFGPTFAFPVIQVTAEKRFPRQLPFALTVIDRISRGIVVPSAVLVGVTGIYQALDGPFELGTDSWMDAGLALWALILAGALLIYNPAIRRARAAAERMIADAGPSGEVTLSNEYRRTTRLANVVGTGLSIAVLVVVYLMEVKPF